MSSRQHLTSVACVTIVVTVTMVIITYELYPVMEEITSGISSITQNDFRNRTKCVKRFPTAITVGIQKCGTSALGTFLDIHPQIVHAKSEPQFFVSRHIERGFEWYRNRMPCSYQGQLTMEKSPPYFYNPESPMLIKKFNPNMKLIFIVKDPIVRIQSMYAMKARDLDTDRTFEDFILDKSGNISNTKKPIIFSTYLLHIRTWLVNFKRSQMYFVNGHELERRPANELRKVEKFLNVTSYFKADVFWFNETKGKYCFYRSKNKQDPGCLSDKKGRQHPKLSKKLLKRLQAYFHPLNNVFFDIINQRFEWGY